MGALSGILESSDASGSMPYANAADGAWEIQGTESPGVDMAGSDLESTLSLSDAAEEAEKSANGSTGILDRAKKAMQELYSSSRMSGAYGGDQILETGKQGGTNMSKGYDMSKPQSEYGSAAPSARQVMAMNTDAGENLKWLYSTMKK